jgi:spore germination protein
VRRLLAAAVCAAVLISGCTLFRGAVRQAPRSSVVRGPAGGGGLKVLAFYDDRQERPRGQVLPLVVRNRDLISDLAPLWYHIRADGGVIDVSEADVKAFARRERIPLMPLVNNLEGTSAFLLDDAARRRAVQALADVVTREGYDGINIDFQLLKPEARAGLDAFMRDLYGTLHPKGKLVTIDIVPAGRPSQARDAYDYPTLARSADRIILMTYDAHEETSRPGPVAPVDWVERRIRLAIRLGVSPSRLLLGIADYGYDWPAGGGRGESIPLKQIKAMNVTPARDADGSPHFTYQRAGASRVVWYEDEVSVVRKIDLAKKYRLSGLALWRVGYETPEFWDAIRKAAAGAAPPRR